MFFKNPNKFRLPENFKYNFEYIFIGDNMPGGDRTGPWGMGPRTGRRAGFCSGYGMPGFMNRSVWPPFGGRWFSRPGFGRFGGVGFGYGRPPRRMRRFWFRRW